MDEGNVYRKRNSNAKSLLVSQGRRASEEENISREKSQRSEKGGEDVLDNNLYVDPTLSLEVVYEGMV